MNFAISYVSQLPALTTTASRRSPFTLIVALMGTWAKGELFWDDGESLDTFEHGDYSYLLFFAEEVQHRVNFGFMLT